MDIHKKELEGQKAKQELERSILELEHKYDLMGPDQELLPGRGRLQAPRQRVTGKAMLERCLQPSVEKQPHNAEIGARISLM